MTRGLFRLLFSLLSLTVATAARSIHVYTSVPLGNKNNDGEAAGAAAVARKQQFDLQQLPREIQVFAHTEPEQQDWVTSTCPLLLNAYLSANVSMRNELFKWCVLAHPTADRMVVLDAASPILSLAALAALLEQQAGNVAVRDDKLKVIHGSYIQMDRSSSSSSSSASSKLPQTMLDYLADPANAAIWQQHQVLTLPQKLYELMVQENNNDDWYFLSLECETTTATGSTSTSDRFTCAEQAYCCSVQDATLGQTLLFQRHYVHPPRFIAIDTDDESATTKDPFAASITVETFPQKPDAGKTPNLYEILSSQKCLPDNDKCFLCLREKKGATCDSCGSVCGCFCEQLCITPIPMKHVAERWDIIPPRYEREPDRRIPRIVHQTWYEPLDEPLKYPNMSRMVESFRQSGWEYRFYNDDAAATFLTQHFPPAVLQAYQVLQPGAFKADLFRYCVLLIYGGVYADVDIQLESALDISIPPDAAFVVPVDEVTFFSLCCLSSSLL
jgi:Glycosyltransferase sugar-binding region containing DXD motif